MKASAGTLILGLLIFFSSCIPQSKIEYLQSDNKFDTFNAPIPDNIKIKPNDQLLINVTSFDDISFNYFESQRSGSALNGSNELSLASVAYAVDQQGFINFPILGNFHLGGLTLKEAGNKLKEALSSYFNQPNVDIRYAFKTITILGEVNAPGKYIYTKPQLTVLEALGYAGDINIHGNRKDVSLIRKVDTNIVKHHIDLTDEEMVFEDYYYIQPDDVIYVRPRKSVTWREISTPITLLFSSISTTLLVIRFIESEN